ncbi:unnamed protein product, partial [Caretta caretta]
LRRGRVRGGKVNAYVEQWPHAPPDGLKRGWEGAHLPPVPHRQARALDPVDSGGGGCRKDALASLHARQVARVLDHEEHVIGVRRQDQLHVQLLQHQPCQPPLEETEEGLDCQSLQLAREGAPPPYSSPETDRFGQGPVEPNETLRGSVQHPEKTHKLRSESKRLQSAQEVPMVHSIERQTVSTPEFQKVSD